MSISKKTLAKLERENNKLEDLMKKKDELIRLHQLKLEEIDKQIKVQSKVVDEVKAQEKAEKLDAIATLMNRNGISVDALYNAVTNGDLYGIQELIEKNETPSAPEVSPSSTPSDDSSKETSEGTDKSTASGYGFSSYDENDD